MKNSSEAVQIFSGSKFNNVVVKQVNEDRWIYLIKPKTYISLGEIVIALSLIPVVIAIGEDMITVLANIALIIFLLKLSLGRKRLKIDRAAGILRKGLKKQYQLQDFDSVRLKKIVVQRSQTRRTYATANLYGRASNCEIFRIKNEDNARTLCRKLATFLNLHMIDEMKPYNISDVAYLLRVEQGIQEILIRNTQHLNDENIYAGAKIPEQLLNNAFQTYAKDASPDEEPLLLIRGRSDTLITDKYMYKFVSGSQMPLKVEIARLLEPSHRKGLLPGEISDTLLELGKPTRTLRIIARILKEMADYYAKTLDDEYGVTQVIATYAERIDDDRVFFSPFILETKLSEAIQGYAQDCTFGEQPLVLIEISSGDTAKEVLITDKYVYTRDSETKSPIKTVITRLSDVRIFRENVIYAHGEEVLDLGLPQDKMIVIAQMLRTLAAYTTGAAEDKESTIKVFRGSCTVIVAFGDIHPKADDTEFLLANPDFERQERTLEITKVFIETKTCGSLLLERFITYIVNHPPEDGLQSIQILYQGDLDDLGANLSNALRNTFEEYI